MSNNRKEVKGLRCACKWGNECVLIHQKFQMISDPRGKEPIRLDLSGSSEIRRIWRNGVLFNLGVKEKEINNLKQSVVYRHHWTLKQLDHFYGGTKKAFPSTPMRHSHACAMTHVVERRHAFKKNSADMFFNVPNCPSPSVDIAP